MVRINLLPVKVSKKKAAGKQQLLLFAAILVAGIIANVAVASARATVLSAKQAKIVQTKDQIARLDKVIGEISKYKEARKDLEAKLAILDKLKAGRTGPVRMLDALASVTPKRLWLRRMEEKGGVITFDGSAATIDDVSAFMKELKASQYFGSAELKKTASREEKGAGRLVDFQLTSTARYSPPAEGETATAAAPGKAR